MSLASIVDVDALWHVALYSSVAVVGIVTAYGGAVVALDRAGRSGTSSAARAGWLVGSAWPAPCAWGCSRSASGR